MLFTCPCPVVPTLQSVQYKIAQEEEVGVEQGECEGGGVGEFGWSCCSQEMHTKAAAETTV